MKRLLLIICLFVNAPIFATQNIEYNFDVEYKKATEQNSAEAQNHANAQYTLGIIYQQGLGVTSNLHTAKYYFQQACQNNYQEACKYVKKLL